LSGADRRTPQVNKKPTVFSAVGAIKFAVSGLRKFCTPTAAVAPGNPVSDLAPRSLADNVRIGAAQSWRHQLRHHIHFCAVNIRHFPLGSKQFQAQKTD
jgi:hypothetical protein